MFLQRRASEFLKEDEPSDTEFPPPDQDNEDDNNMHPFSDDEDETPRGPRPSLAAALARDEEDALQFNESDSKGQFRLSSLGGAMDDSSRDPPLNLNDSDSRNASREAGVGGLDSSSDEEMGTHRKSAGGDGGGAQLADEEGAATPATKKRRAPTRKRKRRIAMDAGDTRMSADEIRRNLADASDLEVEQVHPATWLPGVEPDQQPKLLQRKSMEDRIREAMPLEMYLARPTCADRGDLAPALLNFWLRNNAMVLGNEFPYELQGTAAAAAAAKSTGTEADAEEMDEDDEEAEVARRSRAEGDDEGSAGRKRADDEEEEEPDFPQPDDDRELLSPGDDNAVVPFDDEDGVPPPPMDEDMEDPSEYHMNQTVWLLLHHNLTNASLLLDAEGSAERRRLSSLSLGLVNDFVNEFEEEDEEEDDPRQAQGDQLVSSSSKWHKHTVKVFDMLRRNMPDDEPRQMSFNAICDPDAVTRRTACGVFFELLQLKTWDYIELDQDVFYGDMQVPSISYSVIRYYCLHLCPYTLVSLCPIQISPGVRFSENPPAANRESMAGPSEGQAAAAAST